MLLHDPGARFTARAYGEPDDPVGCLYLDDQSPQNVQPKFLSTLPVGRIFRHRCRDVVVNPMTPVLVVVVASTASDDVSAHLPDRGVDHIGDCLLSEPASQDRRGGCK